MDAEDHVAVMHTWILDNPSQKYLSLLSCREYLKKMLRPEYLPKTVVAITLSCAEPWNALKSFQQWIEVLMDILEEHMKEVPLETQDKLRKSSI